MSEANEEFEHANDAFAATELQKMTIAEIEGTVVGLPPNLSQDQILNLILLSAVLGQRTKQIKQRVDEAAIAWIKANGPLSCGPIVYTVGKSKTVKCTDVLKCMELLLNAAGGDIAAVASNLASNPFKHGSCQGLLAVDAWKSVFQEKWADKIVLKTTDTRFLTRSQNERSES